MFVQNFKRGADKTFGLVRKEYVLINHIILLAKQMIYQCRCLNIKPSLTLLLAKIKHTCKLVSDSESQNSLQYYNKKATVALHNLDT